MKNKKLNDDSSALRGLVICKSQDEYVQFDQRSAKPRYYVKDIDENGIITDDSGSFVLQETDEVKFSNSNKLNYFAPNNVGILLSITNKSLQQAKEIFEMQIDPNRFNHSLNKADGDKTEFLISKSKVLYDFIETVQSAVVFAYTSLESFANLSIPNSYEFKNKVESKGIVEIYDKISIEKWISLRQKLSVILVEIYKTEDLTKKPIWSHFIKLEQYRHDIIHQKSIDRIEFFKKYFNKDIFKTCSCAEEIIDFFYKQHAKTNRSNPLWPWLINKENHFSVTKFNSNNVEKVGSIFE